MDIIGLYWTPLKDSSCLKTYLKNPKKDVRQTDSIKTIIRLPTKINLQFLSTNDSIFFSVRRPFK